MIHTHSQNLRRTHAHGYIALIGVLIMGGIMLIAGLSASRSGFGSAQDAIRDEASMRARLLADACAEEALLKLRGNLLYGGNELISVNVDDSCTIGSVGGSGVNNRLVRSEATVLGRTAKLEVLVATVTPMLHVSTWKAVSDF